MKKFILLAVLGLLIAPTVKADTQVFGFQNGQFYDIQGTLKYACLGDGNCFDYTTSDMTTLSKILGLSATEPQTITVVTGQPTPPPQPQIVYVPVPTPINKPNTTPMPDTKTEVKFYSLVDLGMPLLTRDGVTFSLTYSKSGYHEPYNLPQKGDKYTLVFNGDTYEKTYGGELDTFHNLPVPVTFTFSSWPKADKIEALTPDTQYPYSMRIDRGDIFGIATGTIVTLK